MFSRGGEGSAGVPGSQRISLACVSGGMVSWRFILELMGWGAGSLGSEHEPCAGKGSGGMKGLPS